MPVDPAVVQRQLEALGDFDQFFTRKEINHLPNILFPDEEIRGITSGMCDGDTWLIVVTTRRLIFLDRGMLYGLRQMEMPLKQISAVSHSTGLILAEINVSTSGGHKRIHYLLKSEAPKIANIISGLISE